MILLIWTELRDLNSVWSQSAVSWQVHDELSSRLTSAAFGLSSSGRLALVYCISTRDGRGVQGLLKTWDQPWHDNTSASFHWSKYVMRPI